MSMKILLPVHEILILIPAAFALAHFERVQNSIQSHFVSNFDQIFNNWAKDPGVSHRKVAAASKPGSLIFLRKLNDDRILVCFLA